MIFKMKSLTQRHGEYRVHRRKIAVFLCVFSIILFIPFLFPLPVSAQLIHYSSIPCNVNKFSREFYFNVRNEDSIVPQNLHPEIKPCYYKELHIPVISGKFRLNIRYEKYGYHPCYSTILAPWSFLKTMNLFVDVSPGINVANDNFISENNFGFNVSNLYWLKPDSKTPGIGLSYYYSASNFPDYLQSIINKSHVVPGQGYAHFNKSGNSYNNLSFYIAKNAGKYFTFEGGYGKNFFGDGFRSLFLSDAACSYPYLKITTTIWKIKYVNLYTNFKDITAGYDNWFKAENKYGAFHFLSWDATKRLNINLFEAVIMAGKSGNHNRGFDVNYFNPIIFYRPVEFSLGSPDNDLLGLGTHYKIGKKHVFYGQLLIDDFVLNDVKEGFKHLLHPKDSTIKWGSWFNKQAWQLGYKYFDVAGIKYLNFQTEFNYVRPYTYSHREVLENYAHFNQPLADPLGSNFWESVSFLKYSVDKWYFEVEYMHYLTGLDSNGTHFGQDIFKPTYDTYMPDVHNIVVPEFYNKVGQGIKTTVNFISLKTSYLIWPPMNLRIEAGYIYRTQKSIIENKTTNYFFLGIKTSLDNRYYDL